jgi:hypothetical protein
VTDAAFACQPLSRLRIMGRSKGAGLLAMKACRSRCRQCASTCVQVRSMWRSRRAKWRQLTKVAEAVPELGVRLSEFRSALLTDSTFVGCGATWQVHEAVDRHSH